MQTAYPEVTGVLSRQDDRFHTLPYRYGFMNSVGPQGRGWVMFDHQKMLAQGYSPGPDVSLAEMTFVPRKAGAAEGDGYLIGIAEHRKENGRSDLILVDTQHLDAGPIAKVKMPYRVVGPWCRLSEGHRVAVFQCLANTLEWDALRWRRLDDLHKLRNRFDYGDVVEVSEQQLGSAITGAQDLLEDVLRNFPLVRS